MTWIKSSCGASKSKGGDDENRGKRFTNFTYDWKFESVYEKLEEAMEKLGQYDALSRFYLNGEHIAFKQNVFDRGLGGVATVGARHHGDCRFLVITTIMGKNFIHHTTPAARAKEKVSY